MQYITFGKTGLKTSRFGMGCMRFPTKDDKIDEKEALKMIRYAIDNGVNYLDTAYPYHNGESEVILGKALKDGYRERTYLATKSPVWLVEKYEDFEKYLDEQLERLQTDHVEIYLLHALSEKSWNKVKELGALKFLDEAKRKGKIRFAGFSFHDKYPTFKNIIDSYEWDMCQIQLNILDQEYQAGVKGLRYASGKGIPVVIMEPLRGGKLAQPPSKEIEDVYKKAEVKRTPVEWAFRWLYDFPEVSVILSGVSTLKQLKEDIAIFDKAKPNVMTDAEKQVIKNVISVYNDKIMVNCTGCNYCMPCPSKVQIPTIFSWYNDSVMYDEKEKYSKHYKKLQEKKGDASQCVECGQCEDACPQNLKVIELLKEAHSYLAE
ncbi:MAG: aldo/keto reductase [Kosmotogaceae bacterium]